MTHVAKNTTMTFPENCNPYFRKKNKIYIQVKKNNLRINQQENLTKNWKYMLKVEEKWLKDVRSET